MIAVIVLILLLLPVMAGSYALVAYMRSWSQMRREHFLSFQGQRLHNDALRSIELAKAWERAMTPPNSSPELPAAKPEPERIRATLIEPELTLDDVAQAGYDPEFVRRYQEQQIRKIRLREERLRGSGP